MASISLTTKKKDGSDDYFTPEEVFHDFAPYVPHNSIIWEPFPGDSDSIARMQKAYPTCTVIGTTTDFFETDPPSDTTLILSNPPYTIKPKIFARLQELDLPFAMLVPIPTFTKEYMRFAQGKMQVVVPKKRIQFEVGGEPLKRCPFDTLWLTYGFSLENDLNFLH